jgi:hypothetical protein
MAFAQRLAVLGAVALLAGCAQQPATPAPAYTSLPYSDDFGNPQSGWQTLSDLSADVTYDGGALRIVVKQENLTQWSQAGELFKDGVYQVEAKPNDGPTDNGFGVMFRVKDRKNFYHFEISSDGYYRTGVVKDGEWTTWDDWLQHPAIRLNGEANTFKVVMQGPKLTFFINDQEVATKEDSLFAEGDIGVLALTLIDAPGTDISFDNASVTALP